MTEIPGMVERVARAICCAGGQCGVRDPKRWKGCPALIYYEDEAHAVIAAHEAALRDAGMVIVPIEPTSGPKGFRVGDVVTLTGGGTRMTVDNLGPPRPDGAIDCIWFDPEGQLHRDSFLPDTLKPAYKDLVMPRGAQFWPSTAHATATEFDFPGSASNTDPSPK